MLYLLVIQQDLINTRISSRLDRTAHRRSEGGVWVGGGEGAESPGQKPGPGRTNGQMWTDKWTDGEHTKQNLYILATQL